MHREENGSRKGVVGPLFTLLTCAIIVVALNFVAPIANAQEEPPAGVIAADQDSANMDRLIERRIRDIFSQIGNLELVSVSVHAGVVRLDGTTVDAEAADRAAELASRVEGVVTIESNIHRDSSVERRLAPALAETRSWGEQAIRFAPLVALSIAVFTGLFLLGGFLARWGWLWNRVAPNAFISELLQAAVRVAFFAAAVIAALSLLGATAFLSAFLGAAGVLGLAVGFAVRDTVENYISSIMLSIRQPFRPNDHVLIDGREGRVVRLTSRATILMTLDGNHLRIPNATVFKAVILNYSRNPMRRFGFELGIDADDDPLAALETGIAALESLDFVLADPEPSGFIQEVGDSNIILFLAGWIDQRDTSFNKARSRGLSAVKTALEEAGFALPEPIYRLRFDGDALDVNRAPVEPAPASEGAETKRSSPKTANQEEDVSPDRDIEQQVELERQQQGEVDLLDETAPEE